MAFVLSKSPGVKRKSTVKAKELERGDLNIIKTYFIVLAANDFK